MSFDEIEDIRSHVSYHGHSDEGFPWGCIFDALKGFGLGFGSWVVPVSLWYRKVSGLRRGLAIGVFFGSFRAVSCTMFRALNSMKTGRRGVDFAKRFVNAVAGFVGGALFSSIDEDVRNAVFVLWVIIRALRAVLPSVPYGDVVIMSLSASQILSAYVHKPWLNSASYAAFLNKFGAKTLDQLSEYREGKGHCRSDLLCSSIHDGQSCSTHFITFFWDGIFRAVPLYVPVHLGGLLLSSHKSLAVFGENLLRSSGKY